MFDQVFTAISTERMRHIIGRAKRRLLVVCPSIRGGVADALIQASNRLGPSKVAVVVDCDEEVFRLGYGELKAIRRLLGAACQVRQSSGLRIGIVICDDEAWVFAPTALCVQTEVHSHETPNALHLTGIEVERIVARISPNLADEKLTAELSSASWEIGTASVEAKTVDSIGRALEEAPPLPFDVARQVRVFQPYIQYVDISLKGCEFRRRRISIPKSIRGLGNSDDIAQRLRTTFDVIGRNSLLSTAEIGRELDRIRNNFTRPLGQPWGRVILRAVRCRFDARVAALRKRLVEHRKKLDRKLQKLLDHSRKEIVKYYLPLALRNPPDGLTGQLLYRKPSRRDLEVWLDRELEHVFPSAASLLADMQLAIQFRDVTYETLQEDGFVDAVRKAYPHVDWDRPFREFQAAGERDEKPRQRYFA